MTSKITKTHRQELKKKCIIQGMDWAGLEPHWIKHVQSFHNCICSRLIITTLNIVDSMQLRCNTNRGVTLYLNVRVLRGVGGRSPQRVGWGTGDEVEVPRSWKIVAEYWHKLCLRFNAVTTFLQFYCCATSTLIQQLLCNFRLQCC